MTDSTHGSGPEGIPLVRCLEGQTMHILLLDEGNVIVEHRRGERVIWAQRVPLGRLATIDAAPDGALKP